MPSIAENLQQVLDRIQAAASAAGREDDEIELVAISKTHDAEKINEALQAGQILFGESRVQEARAKIPLLPARCRWHFIGHLQKNKIRHALPLFELLQTIDSADLAMEVDRIAAEAGLFPRVFLQVNVSGEASKHGFSPEGVRASFESLLALPRLQIEGLMTIAPLAPEAEDSRRHFAALREFRDALAAEFSTPLQSLSMGMSGDFEVAIEEGATHLRVGTAIFGNR